MKNNSTLWWFGGTIVVAVVLLVGGRMWSNESRVKLTNRELAMICTTDMATAFHIHPELTIMRDGTKEEIPANIGITVGCMNPLHTHDVSGVIHVESPQPRDFTLGDFFAVWKKPFVDENYTARVSVNGADVPTGEVTILRDKEKVVVTYEKKL